MSSVLSSLIKSSRQKLFAPTFLIVLIQVHLLCILFQKVAVKSALPQVVQLGLKLNKRMNFQKVAVKAALSVRFKG